MRIILKDFRILLCSVLTVLAILGCAIFVQPSFCATSNSVSAEVDRSTWTTNWTDNISIDPEATFTGTGTTSDPYLIGTAKQLAYLSYLSISYDYNSKYFVLTADIDLSGKIWTTIGSSNREFRGKLDGQNHSISNVYVNSTSYSQGLFGRLNYTSISNLNITNAYVTGRDSVGILVGNIYNSSVSNVTVSGELVAQSSGSTGNNFGGIAGYISNVTIDNCTSNADITVNLSYNGNNVGGIVGGGYTGTLINCTNNGAVFGKGTVGGIFGYMYSSGTVSAKIKYCVNNGSVTSVNEWTNLGGIGATINQGVFVDECCNTGSLNGGSYTRYIGGLFGRVNIGGILTSSIITNCYSTGDINSGRSNGLYVGGLFGYVEIYAQTGETALTVKDCYSTGKITYNSTSYQQTCCGLLNYYYNASNPDPSIQYVYMENIYSIVKDEYISPIFDANKAVYVDTNDDSTISFSQGGVIKTVSEMNSTDTFLDVSNLATTFVVNNGLNIVGSSLNDNATWGLNQKLDSENAYMYNFGCPYIRLLNESVINVYKDNQIATSFYGLVGSNTAFTIGDLPTKNGFDFASLTYANDNEVVFDGDDATSILTEDSVVDLYMNFTAKAIKKYNVNFVNGSTSTGLEYSADNTAYTGTSIYVKTLDSSLVTSLEDETAVSLNAVSGVSNITGWALYSYTQLKYINLNEIDDAGIQTIVSGFATNITKYDFNTLMNYVANNANEFININGEFEDNVMGEIKILVKTATLINVTVNSNTTEWGTVSLGGLSTGFGAENSYTKDTTLLISITANSYYCLSTLTYNGVEYTVSGLSNWLNTEQAGLSSSISDNVVIQVEFVPNVYSISFSAYAGDTAITDYTDWLDGANFDFELNDTISGIKANSDPTKYTFDHWQIWNIRTNSYEMLENYYQNPELSGLLLDSNFMYKYYNNTTITIIASYIQKYAITSALANSNMEEMGTVNFYRGNVEEQTSWVELNLGELNYVDKGSSIFWVINSVNFYELASVVNSVNGSAIASRLAGENNSIIVTSNASPNGNYLISFKPIDYTLTLITVDQDSSILSYSAELSAENDEGTLTKIHLDSTISKINTPNIVGSYRFSGNYIVKNIDGIQTIISSDEMSDFLVSNDFLTNYVNEGVVRIYASYIRQYELIISMNSASAQLGSFSVVKDAQILFTSNSTNYTFNSENDNRFDIGTIITINTYVNNYCNLKTLSAGQILGENGELTLTLNSGKTVKVEFEKDSLDLTSTNNKVSSNGKLSISATNVKLGDQIVIAYSPNAGYNVTDFKINGTSISELENATTSGNSVTLTVTEDFLNAIHSAGNQNIMDIEVSTTLENSIMIVLIAVPVVILAILAFVIFSIISNNKLKARIKIEMQGKHQDEMKNNFSGFINKIKNGEDFGQVTDEKVKEELKRRKHLPKDSKNTDNK